jgi:1,5-anhydro-D-fructose reductase (1,5-anhydro-D-mannitol-forming)
MFDWGIGGFRMIKVAVLSFWHVHAGDYDREATRHPDTEVVAIWDELPDRGMKEANKRGIVFYESLDELLANKEIEGVIITVPSNMHRDVIVAAANAGKHIFTEKVLATTIEDVQAILDAVKLNQVKLTVSLPRLNADYTLAVQSLLQQGVLGDLTLVRVRLSHNGVTEGWLPKHFFSLEQCGGGAMIDLGCHPMYLTRLFLGLPDSVSANYGFVSGMEVEDNAVTILNYKNGAVGIVEAGFVNDHSPFTIEIHGTKGSLFYGTPEAKLLVRSTQSREYSEGWVEISKLPPHRIGAFEQWVQHIQNGTTADENIDLAVDLTRLMQASNLSYRLNRPVSLDEIS